MKYKILLKLLNFLIYVKRFLWWLGPKINRYLGLVAAPVVGFFGYLIYKSYRLAKRLIKAAGLDGHFFKRDNLQVLVFLFLLFIAVPQTKLYTRASNTIPGQKTLAYSMINLDESLTVEEVVASPAPADESTAVVPEWKKGVVSSEDFIGTELLNHDRELATTLIANGAAITKPTIFPGAVQGGKRTEAVEYIVQPGDVVGAIAFRFGVSVATILWENNLTASSFIRPGDKLTILPVSGLSHTVRSGDTLSKISQQYNVGAKEIIAFNKLKDDGSNLGIGEKLIVPNGVKHYQPSRVAVRPTPRPVPAAGIPRASTASPSASGFVWPAQARIITQYYSWRHRAIDVSGTQAYRTSIYASKSGQVEISQCGWNWGYGCYVVINHGGGIKTLYGHNDRLLVSKGQYVRTGQVIALMGNTGRVYGPTGVHLHYEVIVNGVRVNPLGYVR